MKPDPAYIRSLLNAFQLSTGPTTDIRQLEAMGLSCETDEFYFHLRLLNDQGFVVRDDGKQGIGVDASGEGQYWWSVIPLRLTASGHEFAEAMAHSKAFAAVKNSFITSSIGIMKDIAVQAFKLEAKRHGVDLG